MQSSQYAIHALLLDLDTFLFHYESNHPSRILLQGIHISHDCDCEILKNYETSISVVS